MQRDYPPRVHQKKGRLYHVFQGRWTPLGAVDDPEWLRRYDDLEKSLVRLDLQTVAGLMATFRRLLDSPQNPLDLAGTTRKEYQRQLKPSGRLSRVFGHMTLDQVRPRHVGEYLDRHPAPVMANREKALLSKMFSYAIGRGWDGFNPCRHIEANKERPRDRYVEHWEYAAVFESATAAQRIFMAMSYLYGIREATTLAIRLSHVDEQSGHIVIPHEKGDKRARLVLEPETLEVIAWHTEQPGKDKIDRALIRNRHGDPYTPDGWRANWRRLMDWCLDEGVLAERFTCHDLKAKHVTDRDEERFDAQLAAGHMDPATTKRYLRHPLGRKVHPLTQLPEGKKKHVRQRIPGIS